MKRYAGVVVLYQPDDEVVSHVKTYINAIECLYVIDNSTNYNEYVIEKLNEIPKCKYVSLDGNKGLAVALNIGCNMAKEDGFDEQFFIAYIDVDLGIKMQRQGMKILM